jgi:putative heme-binding domain-containing protein
MQKRFVVLSACVAVGWLFVVGARCRADQPKKAEPVTRLFARENLVAWCIVPFDSKKRGPEDRAAMLKRLGFTHFAYDYRAEHVPTFDAEMKALKANGIQLSAFWFPAGLNAEARTILDVLKRHDIKTQLWITLGDPAPSEKQQTAKIAAAARIIRPIAEEAAKIGCSVALYNHGSWFGEPENQIAIIDHLKLKNVGIVYNLHHGHDHLDRFPELLKKMQPHLWALNLNGMVKNGDKLGKKILPLGQEDLDLDLLKIIAASGYSGPIGILGHTNDDAEERLRDNLDGLDWLVPQLAGKAAGPKPMPRTYKTDPKTSSLFPGDYDAALVQKLAAEAKSFGDARHGALVFQNPKFACVSCHKVGASGGIIGPDLTKVGLCLTPDLIVESVLWPKRQVKDEYKAISIITNDGKTHQGYKHKEDANEIVLREPATAKLVHLAKADIEARSELGSLMPDGLADAMTPQQRRDLFRFLMELGKTAGLSDLSSHAHAIADFPIERAPLQPKLWPNWQHPVNRDRLYDFYAREADYFMKKPTTPVLLPQFPGLDGGKYGHWGNQNEKYWADDRWNLTELSNVMSGVFHGNGVTVPRGVCVRLGERGELAVCFDPDTLSYAALWQPPAPKLGAGDFVKFSDVRHGFLHGLLMNGKPLAFDSTVKRPPGEFQYHGFYRHGSRVLFSYSIAGVKMLDAPWVEDGKFVRVVAPADTHPLAKLTRGGSSQWPQVLETRGVLGSGGLYVVDTIPPPFENPWKAPLFFGDHDFLPDGIAFLCTMQGDVWRVEGLDDKLQNVRWRRIASGLHQALGLVVAEGQVYVLGRDQITRLHDLNGDGEIDFYECFSKAYECSAGGHDYVCGLQRDREGRFYTASSKQGVVRITADGKKGEVLATGLRNPDGLGLYPDGAATVPSSEGDWVPASMICLVKPAGQGKPHFGYGGPRNGQVPDLPLVYLPRGLDNSSGGQIHVTSDRWGPLKDRMIHFSYGAGSHFLVMRDEVDGQPQGGVVPLAGEFLSGAHRGRFNPKDGQLYVTGMSGWGTYTVTDGCFHRVRYTGLPSPSGRGAGGEGIASKDRGQYPVDFHVHENGIRVTFTQPIEPRTASDIKNHFAQAWNYRYSGGYGSLEYSPRHPGTPGHDHWPIAGVHVLLGERSLFLEIPDLQPVNQLHLRLRVDETGPHDLFLTVHKLDAPFTKIPNYKAVPKLIAAHPILADLLATAKAAPNPWRNALAGARPIVLQADKNLTFMQRTITVKAGEPIKLTFSNPDAVPHNWVLVKPGSLERVGGLANRLIAEPDAALRQYIPKSDDVLVYTDVTPAQGGLTIYFRAPAEKGRYPYLCTFPGHWMVMNGQMIVE